MLDHGIQYGLGNAGTGTVEGSCPVFRRAMQYTLNVLNLLGGHLIGSVADQIGHLYATGSQLVQVDHRSGRHRNGIQSDLLVRNLGTGGSTGLGLNEGTDAVHLDLERGLFAITDMLDIGHMVQPVGLGTGHFIDSEAYQLTNGILVVRSGIGSQLCDLLRGLVGLIGINTLAARLGSDQLHQLAVLSDINLRHSLSLLPIKRSWRSRRQLRAARNRQLQVRNAVQ